ncbi:CHAD domain-containing protein [Pseudomonas protegens]|uniref:CHAD domain-containing protein n=1 Tax=Pseudomonas protegens TaxID=380021 RepID=UPI003D3633EF
MAEILTLQVALYHAQARLECRTDNEALHDLRIAVRKIRSLLKPFRLLNEVAALNSAAAEVGRETTPARDLEVMILELQEKGGRAGANQSVSIGFKLRKHSQWAVHQEPVGSAG